MDYLDSQLSIQIILSIVALIVYAFCTSAVNSALIRYGENQKDIEQRLIYLKKLAGFLMLLILAISIGVIWGINLKGLLILASSLFAIVGVGLFASWSLLSNLTSGVILMFSFPFKIGDRVRIVDGENSVEGKITDMTMFTLRLEDDDHHIISYPNNLAIQKPVIKISEGK
jgi:small-conductance mechanosensitive channel